jgi:hypothetical protein
MRTLRFAVVSGLLASFLSVASVHAGTPAAAAGCPTGADWELWLVSDVLSFLGLPEAPASMDHNGDGWTCVRFQELANGNKGWTAVIYSDNSVRD